MFMNESKIIRKMTTQGMHYTEQEKFFKKLWAGMEEEFTEENNTGLATFVLERFMSVLPLHTISMEAMINVVQEAYEVDKDVKIIKR